MKKMRCKIFACKINFKIEFFLEKQENDDGTIKCVTNMTQLLKKRI
jgi:hypothetical protein